MPKNPQSSIYNSAFTLIELSIVLIIIGLVAGGVLVGRDLIRAAEIRSIITQEQSYVAAVNTFKEKYNCIPGDCPNATDFFGVKAAGCNDATDVTHTCNGNGNGVLNIGISTTTNSNETFLFWQHLANSGLISAGSLSGVEGDLSEVHCIPGNNTPMPKLSNASWSAINQNNISFAADSDAFPLDWGNFFAIGKIDTAANGWINRSVLTPAEAYNIDIKIDDGKPASGSVVARWFLNCTNASSASDLSTTYNLTTNVVSCIPQFIKAF